MQIAIALLITLLSACALNLGYLIEHSVAAKLPPLSIRHPLRSARMLLSNRRWVVGFLTESVGWLLYVVALSLAPLSLVQAVSAGGIGILALFAASFTGVRLSPMERLGVLVAIAGLGLLGASLAGGHAEGTGVSWLDLALWLGGSAAGVFVAIGPGVHYLGGGAAYGVATGILFAAGDVSTKAAVESGVRIDLIPAVVLSYGLGTAVLQRGFQKGGALVTAGTATLLTNALPIAAGMSIFGEPLPENELGAVRILSFACVVLGAVALSRPGTNRPQSRAASEGRFPVLLLLVPWWVAVVGAGIFSGSTPGAARDEIPSAPYVELGLLGASLGLVLGVAAGSAIRWAEVLGLAASGAALLTGVWTISLVGSFPGPLELGEAELWLTGGAIALPVLLAGTVAGRFLRHRFEEHATPSGA